ncbi:YfcL protein [Catenovulum agarivorans DS-2]|uniref:YfcL protein n=1 Tax=Catenovulum agarivorans DS-2 TaxID=1328313 RepID=W7QA55_9ALTE|nr:YfcL family protein [Catenovulum agarivorans]EWH08881.1 YfcL protein [Catenovulum agarivorans DS-2]
MADAQAYLDKIESKLDQLNETCSDDMLFVIGYLRGHIMLSAGYLEMDGQFEIEAINQATEASLNKAIEAGELEEQDQKYVWDLWAELTQL